MSTQSDYDAAKKAAQAAQDKAKTTAEAARAAADKKIKIKTLNKDLEEDFKKFDTINAQLTLDEKNLSIAQQEYITFYKQIYANGNTPTNAQLNYLHGLDIRVKNITGFVATDKATQDKIAKDFATKKAQLAALQPPTTNKKTDKKKKTTPPPGGTGGSGNTDQPATKFSPDYKYNAPMISGSYFNLGSIQAKELQANGFFVDAGHYSDASDAWSGQGGRGTIQMDKYFIANYDLSTLNSKKDNLAYFDPQLYGFKFLYNPTTVGMAWGVMAEMSPSFEAAAQDKFNPIMQGLATSTIAVSLLLNRIEDINFLSSKTFVAPTDREVERALAELKNNKSAQDVYPVEIPQTELAEIYKRGTMYDLEYLFKTINGPNALFASPLNKGLTADRGWIRPQVVELHLGQSLRYRGRITELSVNHAVFDARMVPVLSTVNITFARFPDFAAAPAGGATH
jgi:hypothetical protein